MDEVLIRSALNSMLEATKDDATPIIRRLARIQARAALDTLASAPAGDGVEAIERMRAAVEADEHLDGIRLDHSDALLILAALARPRAAVGEQS